MKQELENKLITEFEDFFEPEQIRTDPAKSCMYWGFECGDGWYAPIYMILKSMAVYRRCDKREESPWDEIVVHQVKQKFRGLRFYTGSVPEEIQDKVSAIIFAGEIQANRTCEGCGIFDEDLAGSGFGSNLCEECKKSE